MFITQESSWDRNISEENKIIADPNDFGAPLVSLVSRSQAVQPQYSDISDFEDFDILSSQMDKNEME